MDAPTMPAPSDPLRRHRVDLDAIENGKWVDVRGDRWLVARLGCTACAREIAAALAEMGLPPDAVVPPDKSQQVEARLFSRAILRGMHLRDDPDAVYTPSVGLSIYQDPELRELKAAIMNAADGDFSKDAVAKAALLGNSERRSDGT